jgi:2,3-bisphosphoglycerate-dependent phosphoglycerate mutase
MSLILLRHAESLWNAEDRFTGWEDISLSQYGLNKSYEVSEFLEMKLEMENIHFDYVFTSDLKRTIETAQFLNTDDVKEIIHTKELRGRNYGDLTGMNKKEVEKTLGSDLFLKIRRGFNERPPNGENLEDVCKRVGYYYDLKIKKLIENKKNVIIVAHGNSLRALLVHLKIFDEESISKFEINNCVPIVVNFEKEHYQYCQYYQ